LGVKVDISDDFLKVGEIFAISADLSDLEVVEKVNVLFVCRASNEIGLFWESNTAMRLFRKILLPVFPEEKYCTAGDVCEW
jgi:hypothetical protein